MVERAKIERYEKCFVYEVEKRDKAQCDVSRQKRKEGWTLDRDKAYEDCVLIQINFGDKMTNVSQRFRMEMETATRGSDSRAYANAS